MKSLQPTASPRRCFTKLVVFDNLILTPEQRKRLAACAKQVVYVKKVTDAEATAQYVCDADAVINCWTPITENVVKKATRLEYIGNWGHWWKHRITLSEERLEELGIHLDYIPDYGTDAVAELTWAGILALSRNIERWHKDAGVGKWIYENIKRGDKDVDIASVQERSVSGKTLGVVGLGRIGYRVAQIGAKGFGTSVCYYDTQRKPDAEEQGMKYTSLEDLFSKSDIVTMHVSPDAPEKLVSRELLESMKPEALFVNTSSGHVVDQEALIEILKAGKIKAFLDVYEHFPPRKELRRLPNVLFTYRLGWFTRESLERKGERLVSNMEKYLGEGHAVTRALL